MEATDGRELSSLSLPWTGTQGDSSDANSLHLLSFLVGLTGETASNGGIVTDKIISGVCMDWTFYL